MTEPPSILDTLDDDAQALMRDAKRQEATRKNKKRAIVATTAILGVAAVGGWLWYGQPIQNVERDRNELLDAQDAGATAICNDGTYSYSDNREGTCSHHDGVDRWTDSPRTQWD